MTDASVAVKVSSLEDRPLLTLDSREIYLGVGTLYVFFTLFGCGGGGGVAGLGHDLLMQFSTLRSSKMEIPETGFF